MADANDSAAVMVPESLSEALQMLHGNPHARIANGGTGASGRPESKAVHRQRKLLSLHRVEELARIGRTERHLDIGATATLQDVIRVGSNVVPAVLLDCLRSIAPYSVRNLATLGGNLCDPSMQLTATAVLNGLEAEVELRRQGRARRLPLSRLRNPDGSLVLEEGELLTRIRIPLSAHSHQRFFRSGLPYVHDERTLVFSALAQVERGLVSGIAVAAASGGPRVFRNRDLEAETVGRRARFSPREAEQFASRLVENAGSAEYGFDRFQAALLKRLSQAFARALGK